MNSNFKVKDFTCDSPFLIKPSLNISSYTNLSISSTNSLTIDNNANDNDNGNDNIPYKIFSAKCVNCNQQIFRIKYVCCICKNYILCNICEKYHNHPILKFKSKDLSSIKSIINYISTHHNLNNTKQSFSLKKNFISGLLFDNNNKQQLLITTENDKFTLRPCKILNITVSIENKSNSIIPSNSLCFMIKNFGNLVIGNTKIESDINALEKVEYELSFEASLQRKLYNVEISLYCVDTKRKIESNSINVEIEVNDDIEEEELNEYFKKYSKIKQCCKEKKEIIRYLMHEGLAKCHPYIIKKTLEAYDWNIDMAIEDICNINQSDMNESNEKKEVKMEIINSNRNDNGDDDECNQQGQDLIDFISGNDDVMNKEDNNTHNKHANEDDDEF